jgi:hypothetical protein
MTPEGVLALIHSLILDPSQVLRKALTVCARPVAKVTPPDTEKVFAPAAGDNVRMIRRE